MAGAKAAGAKRAIPLAVSIAAHSKLMDSIQDEWNEAVNDAGIKDAQIQIVGNVVAQTDSICRRFTQLIFNRKCNRACAGRKRFSFWQGRGLQLLSRLEREMFCLGLIRRINSSVTGYPLGNPSDFAALE